MNKIMCSLAMVVAMFIIFQVVSFATEYPAVNPQVALDGNTLTMKVDVEGASAPATEIKVLYVLSSQGGLSEYMVLQPWSDWNKSTGLNKTSMVEMYALGWKISYIIASSTRAVDYIIFTK